MEPCPTNPGSGEAYRPGPYSDAVARGPGVRRLHATSGRLVYRRRTGSSALFLGQFPVAEPSILRQIGCPGRAPDP
jgi:hypothetical protein